MQFTSCIFHHVSRVLNLAAHQLARGCSSVANSVWRGVPPNCIRVAFCNNFMFMIFFLKSRTMQGWYSASESNTNIFMACAKRKKKTLRKGLF
jgi:hypothetical protein